MAISNRTARALAVSANDPKAMAMGKTFSNQYSPANPDGVICLGLAENSLMQDYLKKFFEDNINLEPNDFTYGDTMNGSHRLLNLLTSFLTATLSLPDSLPLTPSQIITSTGLSALLDRLGGAMCDAGETIIIPQPYYNAFREDFGARAEVEVVGVGTETVAGTLAEVRAVEVELERRKREGLSKVRAVLITNPHNPLGICYPREVLLAYCALAEKHSIYLISDEIYLASIFLPDPSTPFTSILSIDTMAEVGCDPGRIVMLYGMSKDFGCNGFRVGVGVIRDGELYGGVMNGAFTGKIGSPSDAMWSSLLNSNQLDSYLTQNRAQLLSAYTLVTSFLTSHSIPFLPSNAGHFISIDLSSHLSSPTLEAEVELMNQLVDAGVYVAPGYCYRFEKVGMFRLTFSLRREWLAEGLKRMESVLGLQPSETLKTL